MNKKPRWAISIIYEGDDGNTWFYAWDKEENMYDWVLNASSTIIIKWHSKRAAEKEMIKLKKEIPQMAFITVVRL